MEDNSDKLYGVTYVIKGRVQGVYYRATATTVAQRIAVKGYVRNRPDGAVELSAQGTLQQIQEMREWCERGPENAHVTSIVETEPLTQIDTTSLTEFRIRR